MSKKADIINGMYSRLRISGLTVSPGAEETAIALERLEGMMAQFELDNICVGYNFTDAPDPDDQTGVKLAFNEFMETNLAVRLIPDFNKVVPPQLMGLASGSYSFAAGQTAHDNLRQVQPPRRMPRGSGNTLRYNRWHRFNRPIDLPPPDCSTNNMVVGGVNDFDESFKAYLAGEIIASFIITASAGLLLGASSNTDDIVSYRVTAVSAATSGIRQLVVITITTDTGRIEIRDIDFGVN